MRTLNRNSTIIWYVEPASDTEYIDEDGFYTGEIIKNYSTPVKSTLNLYPANGVVVERLFGKDASLDMVAVSNLLDLSENALIFLTLPISDYETTCDYTVSRISKSLNSFSYGLRGSV